MNCPFARSASISLISIASLVSIGLAAPAAAQAPPAGTPDAGRPAPAADPWEAEAEAAVLGPPSANPGPAPAGAATPAPRPGISRSDTRRRGNAAGGSDDNAGAPESAAALAIELSTAGFSSGTLQGGIFVGGRLPGGLILGGILDYSSTSLELTQGQTSSTTSTGRFNLGFGARYAFVSTADGRVDLFAAGEAGVAQVSAQSGGTGGASSSASAWGFTVAAGPGLRLWVHEHVAIGYVTRARLTRLSGPASAFAQVAAPPANTDAAATTLGFEGTFQLLGVF